jgi:hypothetical protein
MSFLLSSEMMRLQQRCAQLEREAAELDRQNRDLLRAAEETRTELSAARRAEDQLRRLEATLATERTEAAQERSSNSNNARAACILPLNIFFIKQKFNGKVWSGTLHQLWCHPVFRIRILYMRIRSQAFRRMWIWIRILFRIQIQIQPTYYKIFSNGKFFMYRYSNKDTFRNLHKRHCLNQFNFFFMYFQSFGSVFSLTFD